MEPLPKQFIGRGEVRGFRFTQILATEIAYLYEVEVNGAIYYEVFKKRENASFVVIKYPTAKDFGIWAWTYKDQVKAIQKLVSLIKDNRDGK